MLELLRICSPSGLLLLPSSLDLQSTALGQHKKAFGCKSLIALALGVIISHFQPLIVARCPKILDLLVDNNKKWELHKLQQMIAQMPVGSTRHMVALHNGI